MSSVFTPRIHQLVQDNKDDKARLRTVLTELFVRVGRIQFLILSLVCTGIIFFGKPFIYFWAGPGYDDAYIIVLLLIMPQQVQISEKDVVNGRAFPTMLIWLMLAMSALLVGREAYNMVMHRPVKTKTLNLLVEAKALVIVLILVVTYLLAEITELFVVGAVFCALAFLLFFRCKKPLYYAITVSMAVLIWVVFHFVLNVSF